MVTWKKALILLLFSVVGCLTYMVYHFSLPTSHEKERHQLQTILSNTRGIEVILTTGFDTSDHCMPEPVHYETCKQTVAASISAYFSPEELQDKSLQFLIVGKDPFTNYIRFLNIDGGVSGMTADPKYSPTGASLKEKIDGIDDKMFVVNIGILHSTYLLAPYKIDNKIIGAVAIEIPIQSQLDSFSSHFNFF